MAKKTILVSEDEQARPKILTPAPPGIPQELWDEWALPQFEPGQNGEVTPEEQAAVDEQGKKIAAFRAGEREEEQRIERKSHEAKVERDRQRKLDEAEWRKKVDARLDAIEARLNG